MDRRTRVSPDRRGYYIFLAATGVVVIVIIIIFIMAAALLERDGYMISNVRLEPVISDEVAGPASNPQWHVVFDAQWEGGSGPGIHAQECLLRLYDADGAVVEEKEFGLHVGSGGTGIRAPNVVLKEAPAAPDLMTVECSRGASSPEASGLRRWHPTVRKLVRRQYALERLPSKELIDTVQAAEATLPASLLLEDETGEAQALKFEEHVEQLDVDGQSPLVQVVELDLASLAVAVAPDLHASKSIDRAERTWAKLVRELGISACARELGITPQALSSRLAVIERRK